MKVGVVRVDEMAEDRIAVLQRLSERGEIASWEELVVTEDLLVQQEDQGSVRGVIESVDVVFIAVPGGYACQLATRALYLGRHVFLGRTALPTLGECKSLAALAEEAGAEIGISRPMRFHPLFQLLPDEMRATSLALHHASKTYDAVRFQQMLEDAIDMSCTLAGTCEVLKIESQQVQNSPVHPGSLMVGFRFQNGTYAQIQLRQGVPFYHHTIYAGGGSYELDADLISHVLHVRRLGENENDSSRLAFESHTLPCNDLIEKETTLFLSALAENKPAPVSIFDGLKTLRLVEGIRHNLR